MTETLAARTREAARRHPFLVSGLAAGVVNYTAAARYLDVDGETDAVATALRRYAEDLALATDERRVRVTMHGGVGIRPDDGPGEEEGDDPLLSVAGTAVVDGGDHTALLARGSVDATGLAAALARLDAAGIDPVAAGVGGEALAVVVGRREGADAVRILEDALGSVSSVESD